MEASGGYERMVAALLWEADLPVVVANPARCAISPRAWVNMPRPIGRTRASLRAGRRSSSCHCASCPMRRDANSASSHASASVARNASGRTATPDADGEQADSQRAQRQHRFAATSAGKDRSRSRAAFRKSDLWNRTRELLESVPGVGKLTSFMLVAELPPRALVGGAPAGVEKAGSLGYARDDTRKAMLGMTQRKNATI